MKRLKLLLRNRKARLQESVDPEDEDLSFRLRIKNRWRKSDKKRFLHQWQPQPANAFYENFWSHTHSLDPRGPIAK